MKMKAYCFNLALKISSFVIKCFILCRKHVGLTTDFDIRFNKRVDLNILVAHQDELDIVKESRIQIPEYNIDFQVKYSKNGDFEIARGKEFDITRRITILVALNHHKNTFFRKLNLWHMLRMDSR